MQFTHDNVFTTITTTLSEQIGTDFSLSPETHLSDDLEMDSLEIVDLGVALEKKFRLDLPYAQVRLCTTLEEITRLIIAAEQKKNSGAVA